ncbi:mechanosensitive ion channel family protein [Sciscionella sediminilitoris]|uniref:mechanosensitive ion channel family protein n=1 Tax=Sciscionella sediminilitoris TaxID=1445613 RepID=UPI0004DF7840|nr:mechanosensitive ion channel family protein [Sciscionella sp. SE31]
MSPSATPATPLSDALSGAGTPPDCVRDADSWCSKLYSLTGSNWLASSADWLVAKPATILLILIVALLVRWLARRAIDRAIQERPDGNKPALLRPFKERVTRTPAATERRRQRAKTIGSVLKSLLNFLVFGIAAVLILGELGVNLTPIIASAGVIGVAVGFGAQTLVRDFLSGMFMMVEDQYGVGDVIDTGEAIGTVESVGLRVTTLRDLNGTVWYVRNGEVLRIGNFSQGHAVAVVDVPVSGNADVDEALAVVDRVLRAEETLAALGEDMLEEPQLLGVESVTAEGIGLRATLKVRPGKQWAIQRLLRARIVDALRDAGIPGPAIRIGSGETRNG